MNDPYAGAVAVAVLPAADLDRAELWYGRVGFEVVASYPTYRILRAGDAHVHLRLDPDLDPSSSDAGVYMYLPSPEALRQLHAAWEAAGARIIEPPAEQPYGLLELATEDVDGNLWRVGAPLAAPDPGDDPTGGGVRVLEPTAVDQPHVPAGDDVDWFAVVTSGHCVHCGHTPSEGAASSVGSRIRDEAHRWTTLLRPADDELVRRRPAPAVWSALEYGAHVRDVMAIFTDRVLRMLTETDPELGWWDHEAAIADGFANESDREAVADDLAAYAGRLADVLSRVTGDQWERTGTRREDERFTVELLARFALHEVVHHRVDAERSLAAAGGA